MSREQARRSEEQGSRPRRDATAKAFSRRQDNFVIGPDVAEAAA